MQIRRLVAGAAVLATSLGTVGALATRASASPQRSTSAKVVGTVKIDPSDPSVAYVLAQYSCTAVNESAELWVSVKQSATGAFDPAVAGESSGFGGIAARWEDSHRNAINCDGKNHVERFTVDQVEGKAGQWGTLTKGVGWVQFCLFDDTTPRGNGEDDFGEPVSSMVWTHVN
jgi:hypothetical protein